VRGMKLGRRRESDKERRRYKEGSIWRELRVRREEKRRDGG
jgi:hypothetical protein